MSRLIPSGRSVIAWAAIAGALLGVLWLYTRPALMVTLADLVWACFN